jgi:hypothetical protein
MDKTSVESGLVISPSVSSTFGWDTNDKQLTITTENFAFNTQYSVTIPGTAKDKFNHLFDGDGNGTAGDSYTFNIRTKILDIYPPYIAQNIPAVNGSNVDLQPVVNITFNEYVSTPTLTNKFKFFRTSDQVSVNGLAKYYKVNDRGVFNFFVKTKLLPLTNYTVQMLPGIKDEHGNEITSQFEYNFTTGDSIPAGSIFITENFEAGIGNWKQPSASSSTFGILANETAASSFSTIYNAITSGTKSMRLTYGWDTTASEWLIREEFTKTNEPFTVNSTIKVFLFGDGNNNKFRFCVNDAGPGGHEVSFWYNVDWFGWKEVTWAPKVDGVAQWIGDGVLQEPLTLDSYQFTHNPGSKIRGEYCIDDASLLKDVVTDVEEDKLFQPEEYSLEQNYPNPFNPVTRIRFGILRTGNIKLEVYNLIGQKVSTLVDGVVTSGYHTISFDASNLPSGVYIYKITTPEFTSSKKLVLLKDYCNTKKPESLSPVFYKLFFNQILFSTSANHTLLFFFHRTG